MSTHGRSLSFASFPSVYVCSDLATLLLQHIADKLTCFKSFYCANTFVCTFPFEESLHFSTLYVLNFFLFKLLLRFFPLKFFIFSFFWDFLVTSKLAGFSFLFFYLFFCYFSFSTCINCKVYISLYLTLLDLSLIHI